MTEPERLLIDRDYCDGVVIHTVHCPSCGVEAPSMCVTKSGTPAKSVHAPRVTLWRDYTRTRPWLRGT